MSESALQVNESANVCTIFQRRIDDENKKYL